MEQVVGVPVKLLSVSDWFKKSWSIYLANFKVLSLLVLLPTLAMVLGQTLSGAGQSFLAFVVNVLSFVGIFWASLAMVEVIRAEGESKPDVDLAFRLAWKNLWPYLWVIVLSIFIIGGSFILLVIPGVIFTIWFLFTIFTFVIDGKKGIGAFESSRAYVHGHFWGVLGRYAFLMILIVIALMTISALAAWTIGATGAQLIDILAGVIVAPLITCFNFALYLNLKQIKGEGAGQIIVGQKWLYLLT